MKRKISLILSILMIITMLPISSVNANATTSSNLSISENGIAFICAREGFHSKCYSDNTQSSIGYGTKCTGSSVQPHASGSHTITKDAAMKALKSQINSTYAPRVRKQTTGIAMNQNQFDALVSLCYNCGGGTSLISNSPLVKYLKGQLTESQARTQYSNYIVTSGGKKLQGLVNRRNLEADLFFENSAAPAASQNPDDYSVPTRDIYYKSSGTMTGSDVSWIQAVLYQLGYSIDVDGSFGPSAKKVVEQFQKENGLTVDGSCGPATRSKLKELWNQKKNATYSFTYNANGGTGETKPFTVKYNQDFTIVNNSCGKNGYHFGGWNVKRNNDNTWYVAGVGWCSEETISKNNYRKKNYSNNQVCTLDNSWTKGLKSAGAYTFYATWIKDPITLSFNANTGTGSMDAITSEWGKEITFPSCQFKKEGYVFVGWTVCRVNDQTWATVGHSWPTNAELDANGYSRQVFSAGEKKTFDDSWRIGCSDENIQYMAWAKWKPCEHQYKLISQTSSTCTATGTKKYTCSICGKSYSETIPAKGHTVVTVAGKAATCTSAGLTDGSKCSVCGAVIKAQQTIPAKGHSYGNWTVTKAATCTSAGTESRTCSVCKHTESRAIPAKGHTSVTVAGKAATCTSAGLTDGTKCSTCGAVIKAQQTIPAKGHTIVTIPGKEATCTSTGLTEGSKCSVCGAVIKAQDVIPITPHNYDEKIIAPTETSQGYTLHTCSVCGHSYKDNYTEYVSIDKPQIIVGSKKASAGNTVDVTIAIKNNPGIASMKLKVAYGKDLTLTQVTYNDAIGGSSQQPQTMSSPVTLNWYNGAANSTGDWIFATLTFKVSENATSGNVNDIIVTYEDDDIYDISEKNIEFAIQNGSVDIISYLPGDINGDGKVNNKDLTRLFQYLSDWDVEVNEAALDVNGDGKINNKDLTRLFQYLSDWDVEIF